MTNDTFYTPLILHLLDLVCFGSWVILSRVNVPLLTLHTRQLFINFESVIARGLLAEGEGDENGVPSPA